MDTTTARRCVEEGAAGVVLSDKHERRLAESVEQLRSETAKATVQVLGVPCDVTVEADVQRLFDRTAAELGHLDVITDSAFRIFRCRVRFQCCVVGELQFEMFEPGWWTHGMPGEELLLIVVARSPS